MRGIFSPVKRVSLRKNAAGAIMLLDGVYFYPIINKGAFFMADKNIMSYETVALDEENHALVIIDQTKLPGEVEILHLTEQKDIWQAIYLLQVRGAPAIGVAAGFGLYLAARQIQAEDFDGFYRQLHEAKEYLNSSRPTAVNLSWALNRMEHVALRQPGQAGCGDQGAAAPGVHRH